MKYNLKDVSKHLCKYYIQILLKKTKKYIINYLYET